MLAFESLLPDEDSLGSLMICTDNDQTTAYAMVDFYCPQADCECCKVTLKFIDQQGQCVATLAYGWQPLPYYTHWGLDRPSAIQLTQGFLDPLEEQSEKAPDILQAFQNTCLKDPHFITLLQDRYDFFKEEIALSYQAVLELCELLQELKTFTQAKPKSHKRASRSRQRSQS